MYNVQEVLRMYPPVAVGQVRINWAQDITLAGRLHLPAGTAVWVPHHAIQNATFNWDDPDRFLPGEASRHDRNHSACALPCCLNACMQHHACNIVRSSAAWL